MWSVLRVTVSASSLRETAMSNFFDVRTWYKLLFLQKDDGRCRRGPDYRVQREVIDWRGDRVRSGSAPVQPRVSDAEERATPKGTPSTPRSYLRRDAKWDSVDALDRHIVVSAGKTVDPLAEDSKRKPSPVVPSDAQQAVHTLSKAPLYETSDYETIDITRSGTERSASNEEESRGTETGTEGSCAEKHGFEAEVDSSVLGQAAAVAEELRKVLTVVEKSSPKQGARRRNDGSHAADKEFVVYASVNKEKRVTDETLLSPRDGSAEEIDNPPVPLKKWENCEVNAVSQELPGAAPEQQLTGAETEAGSQFPTSQVSAGKKRVFRFPSLRKNKKTPPHTQEIHTEDTPVVFSGDSDQLAGHPLVDPSMPVGEPAAGKESFQRHSNASSTVPGKRTRLKEIFMSTATAKSHDPQDRSRPWWQGAARGKMERKASTEEQVRPIRPPRTHAKRREESPAQSELETSPAEDQQQESTAYVPVFPLSGTLV